MKTKTKQQPKPEPIGRVLYLDPARLLPAPAGNVCSERPVLRADRPHLIIPMTKDGKCQRARVVEEMAESIRAAEQPVIAANLHWKKCIVKSGYIMVASAVLTRLGWPETRGGE